MAVQQSVLLQVLRLWFGVRTRVGRKAYVFSGLGLMVGKYLLDASLMHRITGNVWTPWSYLSPFWSYDVIDSRPALIVLGLTTLPFAWVGVSMTARRCLDSGNSPSFALLFFVPLVNYALMLALCLAPPETGPAPDPPDAKGSFRLDAAAGVGLLATFVLGLSAILFAVHRNEAVYGYSLFLAGPFAAGFVSAFLYNYKTMHTFRASATVVQLGLIILGGYLLLGGIEGLICLSMAYPFAAAIALLGGTLGYAMSKARRAVGSHAVVFAFLAPTLSLVETPPAGPPLREVETSIEIDASPSEVWNAVVAFSELPEPSRFLFRLGIAYPRRARIEGQGVGAVRYCEFSTGAFVEPITAWEEPRRLAFDVASQPPTMEELSPFSIDPPHVTGGFHSRRGEFRLVPLDGGRTRLEGSTWYQLDLYPQTYWALWSDTLLHSIHRRVLEHIKRQVEEG